MPHRRRHEEGLALMTVLMLTFVLMVLTTLVLDLSTREAKMTGVRRLAAQSLFVAEGGAVSGRAALMALMGAQPLGDTDATTDAATIDVSLTASQQSSWFASGSSSGQNPLAILDYIILNGRRFSLNPTPSWPNVTLHVNWALPTTLLKLQTAPITNPLGNGTYVATVTITPNRRPHASCAGGGSCAIHYLGGDDFEYSFTYTVASTGTAAEGRRRVTFSGNFSIIVRRQSFARFALFTDRHLTPGGGAIWFTNSSSFDGPVHTNDMFRFAFFPKFGTPDSGSPCNLAKIQSSPLTSVSTTAIFYNNNNPVTLAANENVVGGVRRDAPVLPDCTPTNNTDDNDNAAANFTRGVPRLDLPTNSWSQKGVSIGRNPADTSSVSNPQIRAAIPELPDTGGASPSNGIYIPRASYNTGDDDACTNGAEPCYLTGGIFVQGNLDSLLMNDNSNMGYYELRQGGQTVQILVDRINNQTTITNSAWPSPTTRTFGGVPKGYQPFANNNAMIIYVEGNITSFRAPKVEEKEQVTVVASGDIWITDHIRYEVPPVVTDPNSNPLNLLGVYTVRDIIIADTAPGDLDLHGVYMAGQAGGSTNSSVRVQNYDTISPRGSVHMIGGIIERYYGPFGRFNSSGTLINGYGRNFKYDRRMLRGFAPPYFPSTLPYELAPGSLALAGSRPVWRESTP